MEVNEIYNLLCKQENTCSMMYWKEYDLSSSPTLELYQGINTSVSDNNEKRWNKMNRA